MEKEHSEESEKDEGHELLEEEREIMDRSTMKPNTEWHFGHHRHKKMNRELTLEQKEEPRWIWGTWC